jgi:hypothetical protein
MHNECNGLTQKDNHELGNASCIPFLDHVPHIGESIPGTPKLTSTGQDRDIFLAHVNYRCADKKQNNKKQN